jgi:hypothetical protein
MAVGETHHQEEPSRSEVTTIGLDLAKHVFQVHGIDASGATVLRKQLRRGQVVAFFAALPRCLVGLEACATAHYWARELQAVGHEIRLMPAQYVKAYVKCNQNDAADAEAICEAVGRPSMRFVAIKTAEQQAALLLHRGRERLVRQRTALVNALRAHLAEFGVIAPHGLRNVAPLLAIVRDESDTRLPDLARQVLGVLASQLEQLGAAVAAIEKQLAAPGRCGGLGQQDGAHRLGGDAPGGELPASARSGVNRLRTRACGRARKRDGTVGRSDAIESSLALHRDSDPVRMMRPRCAEPIRASSPPGLHQQAGHMTASDTCTTRNMTSCTARAIHT